MTNTFENTIQVLDKLVLTEPPAFAHFARKNSKKMRKIYFTMFKNHQKCLINSHKNIHRKHKTNHFRNETF